MTLERDTIKIAAVSAIALIGMAALCATLFFKNYADPSVLIAIIGITGTALGSLGVRSSQAQPQLNGTSVVVEDPKPTYTL